MRRLARVCPACLPSLLTNTVITVTITVNKECECHTLGGRLMCTWIQEQIPGTYQGLLAAVTELIAEHADAPRFATDGFAYDKYEFGQYYAEAADTMWMQAAYRTFHTRLVLDGIILSWDNYDLLLTKLLPPYNVAPSTGLCRKLKDMLGFHDYIPPHLWPHEPTGADELGLDGWAQCTPAEGILQEFMQGYTLPAQASAMFANKLADMAAGRLHALPEVSFAYAAPLGVFRHPHSMDVWPHYYMHKIGNCPAHIRARINIRLVELLAQDGKYDMAKAPATNLFAFGRYAPHYILAAIAPQFETPSAWCNAHYTELMDCWAGGRRAVHRYRNCLMDMHGPTGFIAWHAPTANAVVDWNYLRGGPEREM